jgi:hypothetical protein
MPSKGSANVAMQLRKWNCLVENWECISPHLGIPVQHPRAGNSLARGRIDPVTN